MNPDDLPVTRVTAQGLPDTAESRNETAKRVALFLRNMSEGEKAPFKKSRRLYYPFLVDEQTIRKIAGQAGECLSSVGAESKIQFTSTTRFADLLEDKTKDIEQFLETAGDRRDPEAIF